MKSLERSGFAKLAVLVIALVGVLFSYNHGVSTATEGIPGCMDEAANNFDPEATVDNESCTYDSEPILGCMNEEALNFNSEATVDDESCVYEEKKEVETPPKKTSHRRSGSHRHQVGGQVLGAFTSNSSNGGSCQGMYLKEYMKIGSANNSEEVTKLQAFLNEQGIYVPVTGYFGTLTEAAVKKFQAAHAADIITPWGNLEAPTGYVYKTTRYVINNMVCPGSEAKPVLSE